MPDTSPLAEQLAKLLADTTTLYQAAHGAHWNVTGSDFSEYHALFEAVYTDVYESLDPIAENIRKLDALAPFGLADLVGLRELADPPVTSDPQGLCQQLLDANTQVLACLDETFQLASGLNQQGIANFIAERIDQHQKWAWQLRMSVNTTGTAQDAMPRSTTANPEKRSMAPVAIRVPSADGETRTAFVVPFKAEWRDSGNPATPYETTLRGHAAVFNSMSEDLGGFRELIAPGAFRAALRKNPDVRLLFNHDSNYVLARTASGTLELREDAQGLHVFARVDRRMSWVEDLRTSMARGDIDQMSFAFTVADGGDTWAVADDGKVVRTINADGVDGLYDVSVVTYPAYTSTSVDMRDVLMRAATEGRLPEGVAAPVVEHHQGAGPGSGSSSTPAAGLDANLRRLAALRARAAAATATHQTRSIS